MVKTHPRAVCLRTTKKCCQHIKNVRYSLTSLPLLSSAAPHLSSTLPVRTGSGNTRRKSFPGLESAGEIRAVQAHQRASGTISRWENRPGPYLWLHMWEREIEDTQVSALLTCTPGALVLTLKMCHESRKKMQRNNWPKLSHNLLFILLFLKA